MSKSKSLPSYNCGNSSIRDDSAIADCFADFFESVYVASDGNRRDERYEQFNCVDNIDISNGEVFKSISSLHTNSCPGSDGIPPIFLKSWRGYCG